MKKELVRVGPLKVGIVLGILQGLMGLIIITPMFLLFGLFGAAMGAKSGVQTPFPAVMGVGFALMIPIFYAIIGFIMGVIAAALYNLIAGWTGGIEVEVRDVPPVG